MCDFPFLSLQAAPGMGQVPEPTSEGASHMPQGEKPYGQIPLVTSQWARGLC